MRPSRRKTYSSATSVSRSRGRLRGRRSPDSQEKVSSSETQTSGTSKTTATSREHNYNSSTDVANSNDEEYHDEDEEDDDESGTGKQSSSPESSSESSPRTSPAISDKKGRVYVPSANTQYVNVAPLPVFHGRSGECPVAHLARFARVCCANNAAAPDAMARIFSVTLEDEAALWYELEVESPSAVTWEETKDAFVLAFRQPDFAERLRTELVTMVQSDGESVYGYYLRMQWILKRWPRNGLPELMLKGIFLDGLREDFRDWIIPQRPNTLEEALRMAMVWEQAEAMKMARRRRIEEELSSSSSAAGAAKMRNIVVKSCGFCGGDGHEESGCEVKKKLRELWLTSARLKSFKDNNVNGAAMANSVKKDCRSLSLTTNIMRRQGEGEGEGLALGSNDHKSLASQCQCWKHRCWKNKKNSSVITDSNL